VNSAKLGLPNHVIVESAAIATTRADAPRSVLAGLATWSASDGRRNQSQKLSRCAWFQ
jgi:hypothetical protein